MNAATSAPPRTIGGRYVLLEEIGRGGMACVHLARLDGPGGFERIVAVKEMLPHLTNDPELVGMMVDEARVAASIRHGNVVPTHEVVVDGAHVFIVMDYVVGASLSRLLRDANRTRRPIPPRIASAIISGMLSGLHAAHEAKSASGKPLNVVHRDVSPQNVMIGADGIARVCDFGIAKAAGRVKESEAHVVKGKVAYMAPEHARGDALDRRADVCSAGIVLWETLAGKRLFNGDNNVAILLQAIEQNAPPITGIVPGLPPPIDHVVARAMAKAVDQRYPSAAAFASALEQVLPPASPNEVARWMKEILGTEIEQENERVATITATYTIKTRGAYTATQIAPPQLVPLSTASALTPARPATSMALPLLVGALLGVIALAGLVLWLHRADAPKRAPVPPPSAVSAVVPSASASEPLPEPSVVVAPPPSSAPPAASPGPPKAPKARANCDPPWRAGPDGILVPKPECK